MLTLKIVKIMQQTKMNVLIVWTITPRLMMGKDAFLQLKIVKIIKILVLMIKVINVKFATQATIWTAISFASEAPI